MFPPQRRRIAWRSEPSCRIFHSSIRQAAPFGCGIMRVASSPSIFIYTRCPLPDVCPRLSANFAYLNKRVHDVALLSITIDPQFDTPAVLAEYARRYGSDGERWRFLTGSIEQIREVAGRFGLIYWPEDGSITHTVATGIIGRDGRLAALVEGSSYRPEQLRDLVTSISSSGQ